MFVRICLLADSVVSYKVLLLYLYDIFFNDYYL
jgi:hypothetical protein